MYSSLELFLNSLENTPSSIVFYLEMKVEVEVGVHNIRSRFTPRVQICWKKWTEISKFSNLSVLTRAVATFEMSFLKPNEKKF